MITLKANPTKARLLLNYCKQFLPVSVTTDDVPCPWPPCTVDKTGEAKITSRTWLASADDWQAQVFYGYYMILNKREQMLSKKVPSRGGGGGGGDNI